MWPWWSAAYEPEPLPRWDASYEGPGGFELGLSRDTNGLLVGHQLRLLVDPASNLRTPLEDVLEPARTFFAWWSAQGTAMRPVKHGLIVKGASRRIDPKQDPQHVPHEGAAAYWYRTPTGRIAVYPEMDLYASRDSWGVELPAGDPKGLACTIAQHNAVIDAVGAFAARRLATIRQPLLVKGLSLDHGLQTLDAGAREVLELAMQAPDLLPYPGERAPTKQGIAQMPPRTLPPDFGPRAARPATVGESDGAGVAVAVVGLGAAAGAGIWLWRRRR